MVDYEAIRKALEAGPTPGVWHWDSDPVKGDPIGRVRYQVTTIGKTITKVYYSSFEGGPTNAEADARYIAACNPEAITDLLADQDRLAAEVESLRRDAQRLDWLEVQINKNGAIHLHDGQSPYGLGLGLRPGYVSRTLREALDAATQEVKP